MILELAQGSWNILKRTSGWRDDDGAIRVTRASDSRTFVSLPDATSPPPTMRTRLFRICHASMREPPRSIGGKFARGGGGGVEDVDVAILGLRRGRMSVGTAVLEVVVLHC